MANLLDLAGKLGPLAIAIAVYLATRAQNRWNNQVSVRASRIEHQKLRLSLLDRRIVVIRSLREAQREFNLPGEATKAMIDHLYDALEAAELVFDKEHLAEIEAAMKEAWLWQHFYRALNRPGRVEEAARLKTIDDLEAVQTKMMDRLPALVDALRDVSRLETVPPLTAKRPLAFSLEHP